MSGLYLLRRKTASFLREPLWGQLWFTPTWLMLGVAKALIFTISFRRLAPQLGEPVGIAPWVPLLTPAQEQQSLRISRVVKITARHTPWNSDCFPQAVAAKWLLKVYGIPNALYFGLTREPGVVEMKAHAWVTAGRIRVTGGRSFGRFTVVGCFVSS